MAPCVDVPVHVARCPNCQSALYLDPEGDHYDIFCRGICDPLDWEEEDRIAREEAIAAWIAMNNIAVTDADYERRSLAAWNAGLPIPGRTHNSPSA